MYVLVVLITTRVAAGFPLSPEVCFVNDGPVLAERFSLDGKLVALPRSSKEIEFVNREHVAEFWQR